MSNLTRMLLGLTCTLAVAACAGGQSVPTPNIDGTAEARVVKEEVGATLSAPTPTTAPPTTTTEPESTVKKIPDKVILLSEHPYNKGVDYSGLGQHQDAVEEYTKAIQLDPDFALAYGNRGYAYNELGESPRAIQDYDKAIQLDPNDAWAYGNRGLAYRRLGQFTKQAADEAKACSLDSQYC